VSQQAAADLSSMTAHRIALLICRSFAALIVPSLLALVR
jgi:hypothetical protein